MEIKEDTDLDYFWKFLGLYVANFQHIEGTLDHLIIILIGHDHYGTAQCILTKLTNRQKIDVIQQIVNDSPLRESNGLTAKWLDKFNITINALREEGERRNEIVHSQYMYDLIEAGGPLIRSKRKATKAGYKFSSDVIDEKYTDNILSELAELSLSVSQAKIQIVNWIDLIKAAKKS